MQAYGELKCCCLAMSNPCKQSKLEAPQAFSRHFDLSIRIRIRGYIGVLYGGVSLYPTKIRSTFILRMANAYGMGHA